MDSASEQCSGMIADRHVQVPVGTVHCLWGWVLQVKIAPSILSADFTRLGEQVQMVEAAGVDRVQVDVMDGRYVPNITFGPMAVRSLRPLTRLTLEAHLMVTPPEDFIEAFADAGADTIIVHQESTPHLHRALQQIHSLGKKAGVALNPSTPASTLSEVLDMVQIILVMTVNPGFGGQKFIRATLPKIRQVRNALVGARPGMRSGSGWRH